LHKSCRIRIFKHRFIRLTLGYSKKLKFLLAPQHNQTIARESVRTHCACLFGSRIADSNFFNKIKHFRGLIFIIWLNTT